MGHHGHRSATVDVGRGARGELGEGTQVGPGAAHARRARGLGWGEGASGEREAMGGRPCLGLPRRQLVLEVQVVGADPAAEPEEGPVPPQVRPVMAAEGVGALAVGQLRPPLAGVPPRFLGAEAGQGRQQ